jgi:hypothetical protein
VGARVGPLIFCPGVSHCTKPSNYCRGYMPVL